MRQKEITLLFLFILICVPYGKSQSSHGNFAVKSNLLYAATGTFNLSGEMRLTDTYSIDLSGSYNPWTYSNNKKLQHWMVSPELRYWTNQTFNGHFFGFHAFHGRFNTGGISILGLKNERREGNFTGAGFSYGYVLPLNNHWRVEGTLGLGYAYQDYERFACAKCGESRGHDHKNYVGPTKAGISLIYGF